MAEEQKQSIVLFPFMAQGHIIPFLALALNLEQKSKNYNITIISTPLNIQKLQPSLPPNSSIKLLTIPFISSDHNLPPNIENTDTVPYNLVIKLIEASLSLKSPFKNILKNIINQQKQLQQHKICIISDIFFGWTSTVAKELGLFHVIFSGCSGYGLACYYSLWMNLPHRFTNSDEFPLPDFPEARLIQRNQLPNNISQADGFDDWSVFQRKNLPNWINSDGILFNTVSEFDSVGLNYFVKKLKIPVWPIGPVVLSGSRGKEDEINPSFYKEWLDAKPLNSVLFVCFGSMNTISSEQMMQLGIALEKSGKNFIWVVRPPIGFDINSEFKPQEWLPSGFMEKMVQTKKGIIVNNWAPQVEILSHGSVSAFLSHCGWNSVLESLSHGVPILGWPMAAEQFFNSKLLEEEIGVCIEVARGKSCVVKNEDIVEKIELLMSECSENGLKIREKAWEIREMIKNAVRDENGDGFKVKGSSVRGIDEFLAAAGNNNKIIVNE
ncbi:unnamed protein product [Vicia faba]|uniref:Glycosyltransferase n=1 Tax=Vicia faba TaxID=3906 RepID=A0AAV0YI65_VICFA|nr:unnamed protein product [Vicia faba]